MGGGVQTPPTPGRGKFRLTLGRGLNIFIVKRRDYCQFRFDFEEALYFKFIFCTDPPLNLFVVLFLSFNKMN